MTFLKVADNNDENSFKKKINWILITTYLKSYQSNQKIFLSKDYEYSLLLN